jgi:hypothetical protein
VVKFRAVVHNQRDEAVLDAAHVVVLRRREIG